MNNNNVMTEFIINVKLIFITYLAMEKLGLAQKVIYLSIYLYYMIYIDWHYIFIIIYITTISFFCS